MTDRMIFAEIPLIADNQHFSIELKQTVKLNIIWRDEAGWIVEIIHRDGGPLVLGIPLILNTDLLLSHPEIAQLLGGTLWVLSDTDETLTCDNLGVTAKLYYVRH